MRVGYIFKDQFGTYKIVVGLEQKGNKKKMITKSVGEYILKHTMINLEHMSASQALERIMDICGIDQDDKFIIRSRFHSYSRPNKRNIPNGKR